MNNKKYRIKNTQTGNFVVEDEKVKQLEDASTEPRAMDDDEIDGIRKLYKVTALYNDHKTFADDMYSRVQTNQKMITEKQAAYLWHLVHRYRRQIPQQRIVQIAEERKVY